jgi:hypothetical protein
MVGMSFVNTDGLSFIGPGSEWFWTAFQGVIVALTLWGLLRQVRIQTAQKMRQDVTDLSGQWSSERMLRHRLTIATALREGTLEELRGFAPPAISGFWEELAALVRAKHLDRKMMLDLLGEAYCSSWRDLEPYVRRIREAYGRDDFFCDWEWMVDETVRIEPIMAASFDPPPNPAGMVNLLQDQIDVEVALRH